MRSVTLFLLALAGCAPPACSDREERLLAQDVQLLARDDGRVGQAAARRLVRAGRRAVAILETGLYAADPGARKRIVRTLAEIDSLETLPILSHLARRDPDPEVRAAAEQALARRAPGAPRLTHP